MAKNEARIPEVVAELKAVAFNVRILTFSGPGDAVHGTGRRVADSAAAAAYHYSHSLQPKLR